MHDADEAGHDRSPTPPADILAEEKRGAGGDAERNGLEDDHGVGDRHVEEGDQVEERAAELADATPENQPRCHSNGCWRCRPSRDDRHADEDGGEERRG